MKIRTFSWASLSEYCRLTVSFVSRLVSAVFGSFSRVEVVKSGLLYSMGTGKMNLGGSGGTGLIG